MSTFRTLHRSLAVSVAAACLTAAALAGTPGDIGIISDYYYKLDRQFTKLGSGFMRGVPKTVSSTVKKLEKADAKGKSPEALTLIANTAIAKFQAKSDKVLIKLFALNDEGVARLTELEAPNDFLIALSYSFTGPTDEVIQGTADAIDAINTALANEITD